MNAAASWSPRARRLAGLAAVPRWSVVAGALTLALGWVIKDFYSQASAADLRVLLAPTAQLVSWIMGGGYAYEQGAGWVSQQHAFIIAPVCAGVNFALAAWVALVAGALPHFASLRSVVLRLAAYAAIAYVATLLVNAARISLAIALHHGLVEVEALSAAELHRIEGIAVYLLGLCAVFAATQAGERALAARRARRAARAGHARRAGRAGADLVAEVQP